MVLTTYDEYTNVTSSRATPGGQAREWPWMDVRDRWPWAGTDPESGPIDEDERLARAGPGSSGGVPWLWQLLSCVANGWEERSGLLRLAAATAAQPVRARALNALGQFAWQTGDLASARGFYQEALVIGRATRDDVGLTCSLSGLATVAVAGGAYDLARSLQEESLAIRRALRDDDGVARGLAMLGWLAAERGDHVEARACFDESLAIRRVLEDRPAIGISLLHLGWLAHLRHDRGTASRLLGEALGTVWPLPERWKLAALLGVLGRPPLVGTMVEQTARLLTGAEALDEPPLPLAPDDARSRQAAEVRGRLSARELAAVWTDGRATSIEALVEHALRAAPSAAGRGGRGPDARQVMILTPREREVAALVGRGYTNQRIADALVITERTAETHVRNIREKLGFATRAQVAAWAAEHGLLDKPDAG